jgi:hypothetical protein
MGNEKQKKFKITRLYHQVIDQDYSKFNYLGGGSIVKTWTKRFAPSVVSGSSPVVAHMMATGGLHGR